MKNIARLVLVGLTAALLFFSTPARALEESTRKPFYIQGEAIGFSYQPALGGNTWFHQDVEFGYHTTHRHDGFVIGVRQGFDWDYGFGGCSVGETVARLGFDFAIPFKGGKFEMTIAPYGVIGLNYTFGCGRSSSEAGLRFGGGIELKFFVYKGFYVLVRPAEGTGADYFFNGTVYFHFNTGAGVGFAF